MAAIAVLQRPDDRGVQRRHVPDPEGARKHPDEAFTVLTYLLGDARRAAQALRRHAGRRAEQDASSQSPPEPTTTQQDRLAGRHGRHPVRRQSRTSSRTCRPTTRPSTCSTKFPTKWQSDARAWTWTPRSPTCKSQIAGRSGTRAAARPHDRPPERAHAPAARRSPRSRALAWRRGALGLHLHRAVAHRVPRCSRAFPMIATLVFTFTNINLAQAEPLRFVGLRELRQTLLARPAGLGRRSAVTLKFAAAGAAGRGRPAVRRRPAAQQPPPAGLGRVPGPVLPALRGPVRGGRPDLAAGCSTPTPAGSNWLLRLIGVQNPPDWLARPGLDLSRRSCSSGVWGIGAGIIVYLAGLRGHPDRALRRGPDRRRRRVGVAAPRDPADDVAGHLLHAVLARRRRAPVLPRPARAQQRAPASRAARRSSSTSTSTRTSSPYQNMSYGATLAWLLFAITLVITLVLFRTARRWVYYAGGALADGSRRLGRMAGDRAPVAASVGAAVRRSGRRAATRRGDAGTSFLLTLIAVVRRWRPSCRRCSARSRARSRARPDHRRPTRRSARRSRVTFTYQGKDLPTSTRCRSTASTRDARPVQAGPQAEHVRRPGEPGGRADHLAGLVADARPRRGRSRRTSRTSRGLGPDRLPAAAVQHGRDRDHRDDRDARVVHARRLRLRAVPVPGPEPAVHAPDRHDLPARRRDDHPDLHDLRRSSAGSARGCRCSCRRSSPTPTTCSCCASTS